jgi:N-acetylmuramoyl-L-alanine amidase
MTTPNAAAPTAFVLLLLVPDGAGSATGEVTAPPTSRDFVNILGRTQADAKVWVGGEATTVFATGVFARDRVPLQLGANRITVQAQAADGSTLSRDVLVERTAPPPTVAWPTGVLYADGRSLRPDQTQCVLPGEDVEVAVRATPGQRVQARLPGQTQWSNLNELPNSTTEGVDARPSQYRALLRFDATQAGSAATPQPVQLRIGSGDQAITALTPGTVAAWPHNNERLVVTGTEGADLLHGLHDVRLGGPFLAELPAGVLLNTTGQQGDFLRVQLSPNTSAWVARRSVAPVPAGTPAPRVNFSSLALSGAPEGDVLTIALGAAVPFAVHAVAAAGGPPQLHVDLYGAHHATTWITHRANARVVQEVTAEQAGPGHVRLKLLLKQPDPLRQPQLWGWRAERTASGLRVVVRAPPPWAAPGWSATAALPLAGLHVALEAGHGGPDNLGAVGATGVPEKDINLWTVQALQTNLQAAGAQVHLVRVGDDVITLRERARSAMDSQAHVFISVHANSVDTTNGVLRVGGVSHYYKHANGRDLAAAFQRRLLVATGLPDYGLIGNFNYTPMRLATWLPSILLEQAFVSHPFEEAQLLDPAFRARTAQGVRLALQDFMAASFMAASSGAPA